MTSTETPPPFPELNQSRLHNALIFSLLGFLASFICLFLSYIKQNLGQALPAVGVFCGVGFVGLGFAWNILKTYQMLLRSHVWLRANVTKLQPPSSAEGDNDWWIVAEATTSEGNTISVTSDPVSRITAERHAIGSQLWVAMSPANSRAYRVVVSK